MSKGFFFFFKIPQNLGGQQSGATWSQPVIPSRWKDSVVSCFDLKVGDTSEKVPNNFYLSEVCLLGEYHAPEAWPTPLRDMRDYKPRAGPTASL